MTIRRQVNAKRNDRRDACPTDNNLYPLGSSAVLNDAAFLTGEMPVLLSGR